ncbi:MAG: hypothetical protein ACOZNI_13590 [Myxococcota bacterium]
MILLASSIAPALAGTGPWTLPEGNWTTYGGAEYRQFRMLTTGGFTGQGADLGTAFRTFSAQVIGSFGLREWAEGEISIPYVYVQTARTDVAPCENLGLQACEPVQDIGLVTARVKLRLLDEVVGPPLSLAMGPLVRTGEFTHAERQRLTAPTEGQTDFGAFVVAGRSSGLAQGWYGAWVQAEYRFRLANTEVEGKKVPGDELELSGELLLAPAGMVAFGPDVWFTTRDGIGLAEMNEKYLDDPDRYAMLAVTTVKAGGKVVIGSQSLTSLVVSGTGTLFAKNNPSDGWSVGVGVNHQFVPKELPL